MNSNTNMVNIFTILHHTALCTRQKKLLKINRKKRNLTPNLTVISAGHWGEEVRRGQGMDRGGKGGGTPKPFLVKWGPKGGGRAHGGGEGSYFTLSDAYGERGLYRCTEASAYN